MRFKPGTKPPKPGNEQDLDNVVRLEAIILALEVRMSANFDALKAAVDAQGPKLDLLIAKQSPVPDPPPAEIDAVTATVTANNAKIDAALGT